MNFIGRGFVGLHVALYRMSGGRIGGEMLGGRVLLLTTTGNKTGKKRTVPVMYFERDGERYVVASNNGAPTHPAWFKNMEKSPACTVEVGKKKYEARAEVTSGEDRASMFEQVKREMARFEGYEKKTEREIPVVRLKEIP